MKKAAYIDCECEGANVEGGCLIVNRNTLYVKMMTPFEIGHTLTLDTAQQELTETEEGEEELFAFAETILAKMYRTIKLIEREHVMFQRLYVKVEEIIAGQHIRYHKRVFHSENDRQYFIEDAEERIMRSYYELFDRYITSPDNDILTLRDSLAPEFFLKVMRKALPSID